MELRVDGSCSHNSSRIVINPGATARGESQLPFAPLFGATGPFLGKELTQIFALCLGAPHATFQNGGAIYIYDGTLVVHDSTFDTNTAYNVSR
jgi:hypothetical protein